MFFWRRWKTTLTLQLKLFYAYAAGGDDNPESSAMGARGHLSAGHTSWPQTSQKQATAGAAIRTPDDIRQAAEIMHQMGPITYL